MRRRLSSTARFDRARFGLRGSLVLQIFVYCGSRSGGWAATAGAAAAQMPMMMTQALGSHLLALHTRHQPESNGHIIYAELKFCNTFGFTDLPGALVSSSS